jgi:hypothetical protein
MKYPVGLLTWVRPWARLPAIAVAPWVLVTLTVAGQRRIFTGFPNTERS